jgi:hypothetical protein
VFGANLASILILTSGLAHADVLAIAVGAMALIASR